MLWPRSSPVCQVNESSIIFPIQKWPPRYADVGVLRLSFHLFFFRERENMCTHSGDGGGWDREREKKNV